MDLQLAEKIVECVNEFNIDSTITRYRNKEGLSTYCVRTQASIEGMFSAIIAGHDAFNDLSDLNFSFINIDIVNEFLIFY